MLMHHNQNVNVGNIKWLQGVFNAALVWFDRKHWKYFFKYYVLFQQQNWDCNHYWNQSLRLNNYVTNVVEMWFQCVWYCMQMIHLVRFRERPCEIRWMWSAAAPSVTKASRYSTPCKIFFLKKKERKKNKKLVVLGLGSFIHLSQKYVTLEDVILKYIIKVPYHKESHVLFGRWNIKGICVSSLSLQSCNK